MIKNTTPSGQPFFIHSQNKGPLVVYLGGLNEKAETGIFVNGFATPENKERFTIVTVSNPYGVGWESPRVNKTKYLGEMVVEEICEQLGYEKLCGAGWSLGADIDVWARLAEKLNALCICAGSANAAQGANVVAFAKKRIPIRFYHGDRDGAPNFTSPNNYKAGKAVYETIRANGGDAQFFTITNGDHSSAPRTAFSRDADVDEWFLDKSDIPPTNPVLKDPIKSGYFSEGFLYVELESGKILRFKPDE